ncbi:MAG: hypothetical protein RL745_283 [Actinomycetota bacterium]|jgi:hypothetical protein
MSMLNAACGQRTAGWLFIYSCKHAFVPHVESAIAALTGRAHQWQWWQQPLVDGAVRAELRWRGDFSCASRMASTLRAFPGICAEVIVEAVRAEPARRYLLAADLGLWSSPMDPTGETLIAEAQLRKAIESDDPAAAVDILLGRRWEEVLEPLRAAPHMKSAALLRVV